MQPPTAEPQVVVDSNDQCYVCHMPFAGESLAAVHAKVQVWCGTCHGPSIPHIEDENIGATPPDIVYRKRDVDRICGHCHEPREHSILTGKTRRARLAQGKMAQEKIKGRQIEVTGVCTDCHGRHWIPPKQQHSPRQESDADPAVESTTCPPVEAHVESRTTAAGQGAFGRRCYRIGGPGSVVARRRFRASKASGRPSSSALWQARRLPGERAPALWRGGRRRPAAGRAGPTGEEKPCFTRPRRRDDRPHPPLAPSRTLARAVVGLFVGQ